MVFTVLLVCGRQCLWEGVCEEVHVFIIPPMYGPVGEGWMSRYVCISVSLSDCTLACRNCIHSASP